MMGAWRRCAKVSDKVGGCGSSSNGFLHSSVCPYVLSWRPALQSSRLDNPRLLTSLACLTLGSPRRQSAREYKACL